MNKFNLTQLRHDVIDHADLPASIWSESSSYVTSWIDWILTQMIGSDSYDLMQRTPGSTIKFYSYGHQLRLHAIVIRTTIDTIRFVEH